MATVTKNPSRAEKEKVRKRIFSRRSTAEDAEIGKPRLTLWQMEEGERLRELCKNDLETFNVLIFPKSTGLKPFGQVQRDSIAHDQSVIDEGGKIVKAEPRAFGKTTRTANATLWAALFGKRSFVVVFSASMDKSKTQIMEGWKTELLTNERLYWMFPWLLWPLICLDNKPQRCNSQTMSGRPTRVKWTSDRIVFPNVPGVAGSGAIIMALPLKSARGANHKMQDGTVLRPDLLIFDDVQKDEDAENPKTIAKREDDIEHTAMLLGGHSKSMSAIMNCTVRKPDDLSERYLKKAGWRRVRYKLLTKRADNEKTFWLGQYRDIRLAYDPEDPIDQKRAHKEALQCYRDNREIADAGAEVTWEWAYEWADDDPTEISAIQHAYNYLIDKGENVFLCECQNEPAIETGGLVILKPDQMKRKQSSFLRNEVPASCIKLTAQTDIHDDIHYWSVWAWEPRFTGYLIDYGTYPIQRTRYFSHEMLPVPLSQVFPGCDVPARVTAGLNALIHGLEHETNTEYNHHGLLHREWLRTDAVPLKIAMMGIDANGAESQAVKDFIRGSVFKELMYPSFGRGILATTPPMSTWRKQGRRDDGPEWITQEGKPGEPIGILFDTNFWKTQFHKALSLAPGSQGASYVYKVDDPEHHRLLADHWYAERPKEVICGNRVVYEFPQKFKGDNHLFDTGVGARVAASKVGIRSTSGPPGKKKVSFAAMQAAARARR